MSGAAAARLGRKLQLIHYTMLLHCSRSRLAYVSDCSCCRPQEMKAAAIMLVTHPLLLDLVGWWARKVGFVVGRSGQVGGWCARRRAGCRWTGGE